MGCSTSKRAADEKKSDEKKREIPKADEKPEIPKPDSKADLAISGGGRGNILDRFPNASNAQRKLSVCGIMSDAQQKGFADKDRKRCGDIDGLAALKVGCACKKGLKPESPNQDDFCVFRVDNAGMYGVFDGHGPYGHDISSFVQEKLPQCFVHDPDFHSDPEKALEKAFSEAQQMCLKAQTENRFDCMLSGTTATLCMHKDDKLWLAHVGDSRAVLAKAKDGDVIEAEELTKDHKPDREDERKRIQAKGGEVKRLVGDIPYRVFVTGKLYPGLAMTRSIGDAVGTTAGVWSKPEVDSKKIEKTWKFLLLCSDGVWEVMKSQDAVDMIKKYSPLEAQVAADALCAEAWNRWIQDEGNVVDDITVICVWFNE